jgi:hypothetical protein
MTGGAPAARRPATRVGLLATLVWLAGAPLLGCGGGSSGGEAGAGGAGGSGSPGTGGGGGTGAGGARRDAAADLGPAVGTCTIPERTADPLDCTDFTPTGAFCDVERGIPGDGGIYVPGGDFIVPTGGSLVDGDYDLLQFYGAPGSDFSTRRTLRFFGSGTYIEWSADNSNPPSDGGTTHYRFNTTVTPSGNRLNDVVSSCLPGALPASLGYSANGDQLELIDFGAQSLFVYQRRCTR